MEKPLTKTVYRLNKIVPYVGLPMFSILEVNERGIIEFNKKELPFLNESFLSLYCETVLRFLRKYENNTVLAYYNNDTRTYDIVTIVDYNENTGKYRIKCKKWRNNTKLVKVDELFEPEKYYFVSSAGRVQTDFTYRDIEVEEYRKKMNNFFKTKEECEQHRIKLLNS